MIAEAGTSVCLAGLETFRPGDALRAVAGLAVSVRIACHHSTLTRMIFAALSPGTFAMASSIASFSLDAFSAT